MGVCLFAVCLSLGCLYAEHCSNALEDDPHDGKARFLRAKGYKAVGDLVSAEEDFKALRSDGFASEGHRRAGLEGLRQLRLEAKQDRHHVSTLFQGITDQVRNTSTSSTLHEDL